MPRTKLTKLVADRATPKALDYEIRDTLTPGFLLKITPRGRKTFMVAYTTRSGQRRKPAIGQFGQLTVEEARAIAQDWLADARRGGDPSGERQSARQALTVRDLCEQYLSDYAIPRNKPRTVKLNRGIIKTHILPSLGKMKIPEVSRSDVARLIAKMQATPTSANHALAILRKMFNLAEAWGYRPDGTNPCRLLTKYPERGRTRLITDDELRRIFAFLERAEAEKLIDPFIIFAVRLQFAFAARASEILELKWEYVDFGRRRVVWPDSKTGSMSKPLSSETAELLARCPRIDASDYVIPGVRDPTQPLSLITYYKGWTRILEAAGVPHCGTHAIRHRAATDIANSGVPVKVGMTLTAHKTVTMFMRYVHVEDDAVRQAAEAVASLRSRVVGRG